MTPEQKLNSVLKTVEQVWDETRYEKINKTFVIYSSDAISILEEALRLQREKCLEDYIKAVGICDPGECYECDLARPAILNAPQPEME